MAGIYIHIPFCKKACHYCDFHFSTTFKHKDRMLAAIVEELKIRSKEILESIDTIYFGGGTPSLLSGSEIKELISIISHYYSCSEVKEITLECNPDDTSLVLFEDYFKAGVNRLSVGIQSFDDKDLKYLGRVHHAQQAHDCLLQAKSAGFENISADIIYGIPYSTEKSILTNLEYYFEYNIPHISAYALTIEPKTYLSHAINIGKSIPVNDDLQNEHFFLIRKKLQAKGYDHYEISNYCLNAYKSRHNSNYWKRINYMGVGPSAHSYLHGKRRWNVSNNGKYMRALEGGFQYWEEETLDEISTYNEKVLVGLRIMDGIDSSEMGRFQEHFIAESKQFVDKGWLEVSNNVCRAKKDGLIWLDYISEQLFYVE